MADYLTVAIDAARRAGQIQRDGMRRPVLVREATRFDIKLQTDVDCEECIRAVLLDAFPDHAILGEEGGGAISAEVPTWIVDPLDGTVNYARRLPHFCTSIALQAGGRTLVGVVYDPLLDELYSAEAGTGAFLNGARIAVSRTEHLRDAALAMGFAKSVQTMTDMLDEMRGLAPTVQKIRILGAAALDLAYVACGRLDGFIEYGLQTWDIAAGALLVNEAGGHVQQIATQDHAWNVRADNNKVLNFEF